MSLRTRFLSPCVIATLFFACGFTVDFSINCTSGQSCWAKEISQSVQADQIPAIRRTISSGFHAPAQGEKIKIAFFDADSTLRVAPSGAVTPNSATDVAILPLVSQAFKDLAQQGYLIGIVSNQLGVSAGYITLAAADGALHETCVQYGRTGALIHYYDFAEAKDENRKPEMGMANRLSSLIESANGVQVDWEHSFMVGDSGYKKGVDTDPSGKPGEDVANTDRLFAETVAKVHPGFTYKHPRDFFGWAKYGIRNFENFQELQAFYKDHPELNPDIK
ncbi:MAG: HAD-IIIA family hydrolase [Candidatus Riflebacteria bacterium]|nr:HAD-IIIA family hydrolase [Candidatus Riflebacteria bacterium]